MLSGFLKFLLVTTVFCIAYGAGISTSSQTPSPQSPQGGSPMARPQRDLSGTYVGLLKYLEKGLYGEAKLVITGNRFTFTIESTTLTGRITASGSSRQFLVEMIFDSEPPSSAVSPISLAGFRQGEDIWLGGPPGGKRAELYFGTGRLLEQMGSGNSKVFRNGGPKIEATPAPPKPKRVQQVGSAPREGAEDSNTASQPQQGSSPSANADTGFFSKLKSDANVVFTTPESMKMEETKVIELLVSPSKTIEELTAKLSEPGQAGTGSTKYADRMEAQLTGTGFTITPISPAIQPVEPGHITKWMWQIKPKDGGAQRLDLTLNAVLNDGKDRSMVETFKRDINIKVSWSQRASSFVGGLKDLQWLWAVIIVPIGGAIYGWWRKKRKGQGRRRKK